MGHDNGAAPGPRGDRALFGRLLALARPYGKALAGLLLLDLLTSLSVLLTPLPLKIAIDSVVGSRPLPALLDRVLPDAVTTSDTTLLVLAVSLLLAVALLSNLLALTTNLLRACVGERLVLGFRAALFRHAQRLSLSYHDVVGTADATYRIQKDAGSLKDLLIDGVLPLAAALVTVALMFAVTLWLDWQLGLVAALVAPVLLLLSGRYKLRLRQQAREVKKLESGALAVVQEVLSVLRVVKAFGQEEREQERFLDQSRLGMRARLRQELAEGGYGVVIRMTVALGTAAVLFLGVTHVLAGTLTLGELMLVLYYLAQLYDPLKTISRKAGGLQAHLVSAERAFALLDQAPDVADRTDARPLARAAGAIAFRNVSFGYGEGRPVLRGASFTVEPGTRLGIVGATGAGKTTLLNLLTRFYDPAAGQVLLDGRDLRDYRLADLRAQFALVLQETVLFSTSIAENIAYARPHASRVEIEAAARAACAHDFITRLPEGYDTRVGERGMCLSGGERQRIAIARAFLKDAPLLLLDEPTSSVDVQTETGILDAMERLMRGRTSIIITHRLTPLSACDHVLVLRDGRVVSSGPGQECAAGLTAESLKFHEDYGSGELLPL
jgi:ATP-binding cassette subfamily B protein